jgi:hypothetical protein
MYLVTVLPSPSIQSLVPPFDRRAHRFASLARCLRTVHGNGPPSTMDSTGKSLPIRITEALVV